LREEDPRGNSARGFAATTVPAQTMVDGAAGVMQGRATTGEDSRVRVLLIFL
jgi:hypothetical protein